MVAPTAPIAAGPKPTLVLVQGPKREIRFVIDQATRLSRNQSVAILARTVRQLGEIQAMVPAGTINLRNEAASWVTGPRLFIGTYHSAKGLEFDAVILPFMSDNQFPDPNTVSDFGEAEANANDGRLLYVGVTRAKASLIFTYTVQQSALLPPNDLLYTRVNRMNEQIRHSVSLAAFSGSVTSLRHAT